MSPVSLSDSVWLEFGTASATTGAATNADSTPTVTILEDGAALGYSPTVTNQSTGLYKVQIDATAGNGFEAGKRYSVSVTATVGGITGKDGIGEFEVLATDLNAGVAAVTGAVGSVTAGVTVTTNNDKTGYTLTQSFPANFSAFSLTAGGLVDITQAAADKAWATSARVLTAGTNIALAKGTGVTGFTDIDASGVRTAVGLASANVDTQFSALQSDTDNIQTRLPAALVGGRMDVSVGALGTDTIGSDALAASAVAEIVDAVWAKALETGFTADRLMRIIASGVAGKVSGGPGSPVFRNLTDTANLITGTADSSGNRTAASYGA
jgi:hypothetical protein